MSSSRLATPIDPVVAIASGLRRRVVVSGRATTGGDAVHELRFLAYRLPPSWPPMMSELKSIAEHAVVGGYLVAMAAVCLLQYVVQVLRLRLLQRERDRARGDAEELRGAIGRVEEDRFIARLENEFLREFVSQTEVEHAVEVLLSRLVPHPKHDLAALFLFANGRLHHHRSRGLSARSSRQVQLDNALVTGVVENGAVCLEGAGLQECRFVQSLSEEERGRVQRLYFLRVGDRDSALGVFVTSTLYPPESSVEQQLELYRRLMATLASNIRWARTLQSRERELRSTTELLELRSITDGRYPTPLAMVEAFVDRLRRIVEAERAALYLADPEGRIGSRAIVRCGENLHRGKSGRWQEHEDVVAQHGVTSRTSVSLLEAEDLAALGVGTMVEVAVVAQVRRDAAVMGIVVFSSRQRFVFDECRSRIAEWACDHLGETLNRVLQTADTERRARLDSLTDLANRREFEERIEQEVALANSMGTSLALVFIDLDHFKSVNDGHGHRAGDQVLKSAADTLREGVLQARPDGNALVARYGGEEIALLLPGVGISGANRIAEGLRVAIEELEIEYDGEPIRVTASFGVAICPASAQDADGLVAAADSALYRAKELGRNRVCSATPQPV